MNVPKFLFIAVIAVALCSSLTWGNPLAKATAEPKAEAEAEARAAAEAIAKALALAKARPEAFLPAVLSLLGWLL